MIRPARPADAAAIAAVHTRSWQAAYEHVFGAERLAGIDLERRSAGWRRELENGEPVWVAEKDGGVVGFVAIGDARDEADAGELYTIYVLPEAWGSGAGSQLLATAVDALRAAYRTSVLWVLEDNPRARRFYEREGWRLDGGRKKETFLGVDVAVVRYRLG